MGYQHRPSHKRNEFDNKKILILIITLVVLFLILLFTKSGFTGKAYQRPDVEVNLLNLNQFPGIFTDSGNFKVTVVYDLGALASVNLIENHLRQKSLECISEFEDKRSEDILIETQLSSDFGTSLDSNQLNGLIDKEIYIDVNDSNSYKVYEEIRFADNSDLAPHTTLTFKNSDRFKDRVFIPIPRHSIGYYLVFSEQLKSGNRITDASSSEPITIPFLGSELRIDSASSSSLTINVGDKFQLNAGESVFVEGRELTLVHTSGNKAKVMVDGLIEVINENTNQRVNGIEIRIEDVADEEGTEFDSATVIAGVQARKTFTDGDEFIGEDSGSPLWEWHLADLNTNSPVIGIRISEEIDDPEETNTYIRHPLYEGESICLPYDYVCIEFTELLVNDYKNYEINTQTKELYASVDDANNGNTETTADVLVFKSSGNGFIVNGENSEEIYMYSTGSAVRLYRKLPGNSKAVYFSDSGSNVFNVNFRDTSIPVTVNWNADTDSGDITLDLDSDLVIYFEAERNNRAAVKYLGHSDGRSDVNNDILVASTDISTFDSNLRLKEGIILEDPESHSGSDRTVLRVPSDINDFKVVVSVKTSRSSSGQCEISSVSLEKSRVFTDDRNLILVGTDSLADSYLSNSMLDIYRENRAVISLIEKEGVAVLLVLGHTSSDIYTATEILTNPEEYDFNTEMFVI